MKLFLLPETGTVDTMSSWVRAAHDAVNCGEETSIDALLDLLVQVKFVKGEWVKSNEESRCASYSRGRCCFVTNNSSL